VPIKPLFLVLIVASAVYFLGIVIFNSTTICVASWVRLNRRQSADAELHQSYFLSLEQPKKKTEKCDKINQV
jgi:hypothetical protein